jgi:predicted pyridoxine 5'-phosphate oxidase superfamily flavin-nucleotide-binding protein
MTTPFHPGEIALHQATGVYERMVVAGPRVIRDFMPDQHRELFEKLTTLFVGALDEQGCVWATVVAGPPGFISTPDAHTLRVGASHDSAFLDSHDPALIGLKPGAAVGLLGLESHTRRRNRANGVITAAGPDGFALQVRQSFGNCPKYIYARESRFVSPSAPALPQPFGARLNDASLRLIASSDTMFIASSSSGRLPPPSAIGATGAGVDVSHRGGFRGFVAVDRSGPADRLTMPDYVGNYLFNTLGNLLLWPRAGLLFVDWQSGDLLQVTVETELQNEGEAVAAIAGAQRLLHMTVVRGVYRPHALPIAWSEPKSPPQFSEGSPLWLGLRKRDPA